MGSTSGIFPYRLAENMCSIMGTCLAGKSKVNRELEDAFIDGKNKIDQGDCSGAEAYKKTIMTKMSIPLIQATLNSAFAIVNGDSSSKAKAEAATYAGSILPQVAKCSSADAEIIRTTCGLILLLWTWMGLMQSRVHLKTIMVALESLVMILVAWVLDQDLRNVFNSFSIQLILLAK